MSNPADYCPHGAKRWSPWPHDPPEGWPYEYVAAVDFDALTARLVEAERLLLRWNGAGHYECEDGFYSCPSHPDYFGNDDRAHCSCGHTEIMRFLGRPADSAEPQEEPANGQ